MAYITSEEFATERTVVGHSGDDTISIPGVIVAVFWAIGLVVGVAALSSGHYLAAGIALVLAIIAPWVGLAWMVRTPDEGAAPERVLT